MRCGETDRITFKHPERRPNPWSCRNRQLRSLKLVKFSSRPKNRIAPTYMCGARGDLGKIQLIASTRFCEELPNICISHCGGGIGGRGGFGTMENLEKVSDCCARGREASEVGRAADLRCSCEISLGCFYQLYLISTYIVR